MLPLKYFRMHLIRPRTLQNHSALVPPKKVRIYLTVSSAVTQIAILIVHSFIFMALKNTV